MTDTLIAKCRVMAFVLLASCCWPPLVIAEPVTVTIGTTQSPSDLSARIEQQLTAAYAELGFNTRFIALPSERRLRLLTNNELDADLFRICQLAEQENLVTVPARLGELMLQAYSQSVETLTQWQQNSELIIVHIRGLKMAELTPFAGSRVEVSDLQQAFGMLLQKRAAILLEDQRSAIAYLHQAGLTDAGLVATDLLPFAICHVLSTQLGHLAAPLAELLQRAQD